MNNIFYAATKKLSTIFNNFVDFTRIGNLLFTKHRYSNKEIIDRAVIAGGTVATAYIGSRSEVTDTMDCSKTIGVLAGAALGFTAVHTAVIAPLIIKRIKFSRECEQVKSRINNLLGQIKGYTQPDAVPGLEPDIYAGQVYHLKKNVDGLIKIIYGQDISTEKRANSSQTWGMRLKKLQKLEVELNREAKAILFDRKVIIEVNNRYAVDLGILKQVEPVAQQESCPYGFGRTAK